MVNRGVHCEGTDMMVGVYDPRSIPRQLRFSLYSGAVITPSYCTRLTVVIAEPHFRSAAMQ